MNKFAKTLLTLSLSALLASCGCSQQPAESSSSQPSQQTSASTASNTSIATSDSSQSSAVTSSTTTSSTVPVVNKYKATFVVNGGDAVLDIEAKEGEAFVKPTDPTKEGYTFGGWYSDEALTSAYDWNSKASANITLYAKWVENEPDPVVLPYKLAYGNEADPTSVKSADLTEMTPDAGYAKQYKVQVALKANDKVAVVGGVGELYAYQAIEAVEGDETKSRGLFNVGENQTDAIAKADGVYTFYVKFKTDTDGKTVCSIWVDYVKDYNFDYTKLILGHGKIGDIHPAMYSAEKTDVVNQFKFVIPAAEKDDIIAFALKGEEDENPSPVEGVSAENTPSNNLVAGQYGMLTIRTGGNNIEVYFKVVGENKFEVYASGYTAPKDSEDTAKAYYVVGDMTEWDTLYSEFGLSPMGEDQNVNGHTQYESEVLKLSKGQKIKVASKDKKNWYPDQGGDYVIPETGEYKVYFVPEGNSEWKDNGFFYVAKQGQDPVNPDVKEMAVSVNGTVINTANLVPEGSTDKAKYEITLAVGEKLTIKEGDADLHFYKTVEGQSKDQGPEFVAAIAGKHTVYVNKDSQIWVTEPVPEAKDVTATVNGEAVTATNVKESTDTENKGVYKFTLAANDKLAMKEGDTALHFYAKVGTETIDLGTELQVKDAGEWTIYLNAKSELWFTAPKTEDPVAEAVTASAIVIGEGNSIALEKNADATDKVEFMKKGWKIDAETVFAISGTKGSETIWVHASELKDGSKGVDAGDENHNIKLEAGEYDIYVDFTDPAKPVVYIGVHEEPVAGEKVSVSAKVPDTWEKAYLYAYKGGQHNGEWPGVEMAKGTDGKYTAEVLSGYTKIIINNGKNEGEGQEKKEYDFDGTVLEFDLTKAEQAAFTVAKNDAAATVTFLTPSGTNKAEFKMTLAVGDKIAIKEGETALKVNGGDDTVFTATKAGEHTFYINKDSEVWVTEPTVVGTFAVTVNDTAVSPKDLKKGGTDKVVYALALQKDDVVVIKEDGTALQVGNDSTVKSYTAPAAGTYIFYVNKDGQIWPNAAESEFKITHDVGDGKSVFVAGTFYEDWKLDVTHKLEWHEGNVWSKSFANIPEGIYQFKYIIANTDDASGADWDTLNANNRTLVILAAE